MKFVQLLQLPMVFSFMLFSFSPLLFEWVVFAQFNPLLFFTIRVSWRQKTHKL